MQKITVVWLQCRMDKTENFMNFDWVKLCIKELTDERGMKMEVQFAVYVGCQNACIVYKTDLT